MRGLTRREWLAASASAVLAGHLSAAKKAALPLGFSLYGMKTLSLAEGIEACAKIGYECVELALMPGWPAEPKLLSAEQRKELRKRLADTGLALVSLMENLPEPADDATHKAHLERLKRTAELGHALAPDAPPVIETVLGGKPAQWEQIRDKLAERVKSWAELAASVKTVVAVKPHVAGAMHTPDGALWLLNQVNSRWLKLAYDHSHFALRGYKQADTVKALAAESVFVHLKDGKGDADKFEFLLPGDGTMDWAEHFKLLTQAGYAGPVVVEVSGQIFNKKGYDPLDAARKSFQALRGKRPG